MYEAVQKEDHITFLKATSIANMQAFPPVVTVATLKPRGLRMFHVSQILQSVRVPIQTTVDDIPCFCHTLGKEALTVHGTPTWILGRF